MVGCSILGCKSRREQKIDGLTFHSFPTNNEMKTTWVNATGRQNWLPTKYSKICSIHFKVDSFDYKKRNVLLKPNSVPVQHVHHKSSNVRDGDETNIYNADNVLPSTSTSQELVQKSGAKRRSNVLQQGQNIQMKSPCLKSMKLDDVHDRPLLQRVPTPTKEKHLKKMLANEKKKSADRLKKLRAVRESKRRLQKKTARLENILAALKCKMLASSEELDLLSNIDTENADFLIRYLDKENRPRKYSASLRKFVYR